jgi:hypothetical protein
MAAFAVLKAFTNRSEQRSSQVRQPVHFAASTLIRDVSFRVINLSLGSELDSAPALTVTVCLLLASNTIYKVKQSCQLNTLWHGIGNSKALCLKDSILLLLLKESDQEEAERDRWHEVIRPYTEEQLASMGAFGEVLKQIADKANAENP